MEDILEKICQCAICLEIFKNPKTLVCQHTFCESCLESACVRIKEEKWSLICPTCRSKQPFVNHQKDVSFIGTSQIVKEITELLRHTNSRKTKILEETLKECDKDKNLYKLVPLDPIKEGVKPNNNNLSKNSFSQQDETSTDKNFPSELIRELEKSKNKLAIYAEKCKKQETDLRRLKNLNMMLLIDNTLLKMKSFELPINSEIRMSETRNSEIRKSETRNSEIRKRESHKHILSYSIK